MSRLISLSIVVIVIISTLIAGNIESVVVKNENSSIKSVILKTDDTYYFSGHGDPLLAVLSQNGAIKGGYDMSQFVNAVIPPERRRLLTDFDRIRGKGLYALLVGAQFEGGAPEALVLKFQDSEDFAEPAVIQLEIKVAGDRLRIDSAGNIYILGLAEPNFEKIIINQEPGDCPLLHKFSPDGEHIYSTLVRHVDPRPEKFTFTYTSPLLAASNFIVSPEGNVWMLWYTFEEDQKGWPDTTLYSVSPAGQLKELNPVIPETGYMLTGLVKNIDTFDVLFEWKRVNPDVEKDTILADPYGAIILKESLPGKILSVTNKTVMTTAHKDGKYALLKYTY